MLEFRTLGTIELRGDDGRSLQSVLVHPKRVALLAYLCVCQPPGLHRRATLAALLWPELDDAHARASLRQELYLLRRSLGPGVLVGEGEDALGVDGERLWCDARAFEAALEEDRLAPALELCRGELLPGLHVDGGEFERWLDAARARLARRAVEAARRLAAQAEEEGKLAGAVSWARRLTELAPYDETAWQRLILLLDRSGDRAGALVAYDTMTTRLHEELEVEPSPETQALVERIREREAAFATSLDPGGPDGDPPLPREDRREPSEARPAQDGRTPRQPPTLPPPADPVRPVAGMRRRPFDRARISASQLLVVLLLLAVAAVALTRVGPETSTAGPATDREPLPPVAAGDRPSVAVLPFANLSAAPGDAYIADGIHDEILTQLSKLGGLRVVSRTSVMRYRHGSESLLSIARELGVGAILEGTVRKEAGRVRVSAQLVDAATDDHLWAEIYDRELSLANLLDLQGDIARKIALALRAELTPAEEAQLRSRPTSNPEAYQAYLRGRYYMHLPHFPESHLRRALEEFTRATAMDSTFALAHAELAEAYAQLVYFWVDASDSMRAMARREAEHAERMDPASPRVRLALGLVHLWLDRDGERALAEIERAAAGLPHDQAVLEARGAVYQMQGRFEESAVQSVSALALSPKDASLYTQLALLHWWMRRYERAAAYAEEGINLAPDQLWPNLTKVLITWSERGPTPETEAIVDGLPGNDTWVLWARVWQRLMSRRYEDALDVLEHSGSTWVRHKLWAQPPPLLRALAYDAMGRSDEARPHYEEAVRLLQAEVTAHPDDPRYWSSLGVAHAGLGRSEAALRSVRRATELLPVSKDALYGLSYLTDLAAVHAMLGDHDAAADVLEELLRVPSWFSPAWIRADWRFDEVLASPRVRALLAARGRPVDPPAADRTGRRPAQ